MEKIWLKHYSESMKAEIDPDEYISLPALLDEKLKTYADRTAYSCMGADLSYQDLDTKSLQFATWLQRHFSQGDRVAVMMPNVLQYPVAIFGILRAGMTVVNVNPLYTSVELKHQLIDSGAKVLIVLNTCAHTAEQALADTKIEKVLTTTVGSYLKFPKSAIVNLVIKYVKKMVPDFDLSGSLDFAQTVASTNVNDYVRPEIKSSDAAFLQYTGGTTGVAKGAVLTHRNMIANMLQALEFVNFASSKTGEQDIIITALPLYHIFSLTANCLTFMYIGGHNILITNPRDIPSFVKELKKYPFTFITGVNTLFNALLNNPDFSTIDFSKVVLTLGGGMAVQSNTAKQWHEVTGTVLLEAYGLTEASPAVTINPPTLTEYNGSIGVPVASTDISIRDDDGNALAIGEAGELWVKGPQVMQGYWNRPEATAEVLTEDGWLKTGDVAVVDEEGFARIVDRKKDMIIVSGFNVYPNEIEDVLTTHPDIMEAACVGVPSEKSGEAVKAFVVLVKGASLTAEQIIEYSRKSLTGYKTPDEIAFVKDLPKNNIGKILRKELRDK